MIAIYIISGLILVSIILAIKFDEDFYFGTIVLGFSLIVMFISIGMGRDNGYRFIRDINEFRVEFEYAVSVGHERVIYERAVDFNLELEEWKRWGKSMDMWTPDEIDLVEPIRIPEKYLDK